MKKRAHGAEPIKPVRLARVVRKRGARLTRGTAPIVVQIGQARVEVGAGTDRNALSTVLEALAATAWGQRS